MSGLVTASEPVDPNPQPLSPEQRAEVKEGERPAYIPEKFWDEQEGKAKYEELARSYTELQKLLSKRNGEPADERKTPEEPTPEEQPADKKDDKADKTEDGDDAAKKAVNDAGLDWDSVSAEYDEKGELSKETREALEKVVPAAMIDSFLQNHEAATFAVEAAAEKVYDMAGGKDGYAQMTQWAQKNLDEDSIKTYDEAIQSRNPKKMVEAAEALYKLYTDSEGKPGKRISGKSAGASGASGTYGSAEELARDMGNPRYKEDPAYRAKVQAKLLRSNLF